MEYGTLGKSGDIFVDVAAKFAEDPRLLISLVECSNDAIFVKDLQGRYLLINTAGAALLGYPVADIIGKDDEAIVPPETAEQIRSNDQRIIEGGTPRTFEEKLQIAGVEHVFSTTKAPYR